MSESTQQNKSDGGTPLAEQIGSTKYCLCCKHWDPYVNKFCSSCVNYSRWMPKASCRHEDGKMKCDTCKHGSNTERHTRRESEKTNG